MKKSMKTPLFIFLALLFLTSYSEARISSPSPGITSGNPSAMQVTPTGGTLGNAFSATNGWSPSGSGKIFVFGDSVVQADIGPTSCVSGVNYGASTAVASLTGTCWPDLIGAHYSMPVVNFGRDGAPMQHCVNLGYGGCASAIIDTYTTVFAGITSSDYVLIEIGNNDAAYELSEPTFTPTTFKANYKTIIAYLKNTKGVPASHIAIMSTMYRDSSLGAQTIANLSAYNAVISKVASDTGVSFIDIYMPLARGAYIGSTFYTVSSLMTSSHPNDLGSQVVANTIYDQTMNTPLAATGGFNALSALLGADHPFTIAGLYFPASDSVSSRSVGLGTSALINLSNTATAAAYAATAVGYQALGGATASLTTAGINNTAVGSYALWSTTSGSSNTGVGYGALKTNAEGTSNTAVGFTALNKMTGRYATAVGTNALTDATGTGNTAVGIVAGDHITSGTWNTAIGGYSLRSFTATPLTGSYNTGVGYNALNAIQGAAANNTTVGYSAGSTITTGTNNTIIGNMVASTTLTTGANNILIGTSSLTTTAAGSTSDTLKICGSVGCPISSTAMNTATPATTFGGTIAAGVGASTNHAVCWKAGGVLGYCSVVVDASGVCGTCN